MPHLSALSLALNRPGAVSLEQVVASLFAAGEQGAWYDPSGNNTTWRRNRFSYTENLANAYWGTPVRCVINSAAATPPAGSIQADEMECNSAGYAYLTKGAMIATFGFNAGFTISAIVKQVNFSTLTLDTSGSGAADLAKFTLTGSGTVASSGSNVENPTIVALGDGWYRCSVARKHSAAVSTGVYIGMDAASVGSKMLFAGVQLEEGTSVSAYQPIITPEITYLSTVQAQPLLFQDSAGTLPVTEVEQPVGLMLDRRKGATTGPELITNGTFDSNVTGWTASQNAGTGSIAWSSGRIAVSGDATAQWPRATQTWSAVVGKWYSISISYELGTATEIFVGPHTGTSERRTAASGTVRFLWLATTTTPLFQMGAWDAAGQNKTCYFDNISVKLLDGNHAYQTTSAARPVLRARYNLLTYSEQFGTTWGLVAMDAFGSGSTANAIAAPDNTTTADLLKANGASSPHGVTQLSVAASGYQKTFSVYAKEGTHGIIQMLMDGNTNGWANFDLAAGTWHPQGTGVSVSLTKDATTGWCRCVMTDTDGTATGLRVVLVTATNASRYQSNTLSTAVYLWGADLRVGTSAGDYQRIAAATDYATTSTITGQPFRPYLEQPTGGDDSMIVANSSFNDFAASDAPFFMSAGVTRYGTTRGTIFCLADNTNATAGNNDTLNLEADSTAQVRGYLLDYDAGGNTEASATAGTLAAEATFIASWQRTATDGFARNNGTAGTGTDQTAPAVVLPLATVFAQRRGTSPTTDQRFTGRMFGLIVRAGTISAGQMSAVETYLSGKSGVTL